MNIVYISESILPSSTANSVHVMYMCDALAGLGHTVNLIATVPDNTDLPHIFHHYGTNNELEITSIRRQFRRGGIYQYAARAAFCALSVRPDFIISRCIPAAVLAAGLRMPVFLESHEPARNAGFAVESMFRMGLHFKHLRKLIVITEALKREYQYRYKIQHHRMLVAPDAAIPRQGRGSNRELKGGAGTAFKVGYVGSLYEGRGVEMIWRLSEMCPWAEFHVIGGEGDALREWRQRTKGSTNFFLHGHKQPFAVSAILDNFDVLLAPYQRKVKVAGNMGNNAQWMSPLKIFEYMAAGKAIICSDMPVLREVLVHEYNSILVAPHDENAWHNALQRLKDDTALQSRIARQARCDAESLYTWRRRAARIVEEARSIGLHEAETLSGTGQ